MVIGIAPQTIRVSLNLVAGNAVHAPEKIRVCHLTVLRSHDR